ncbi:MAG: response regulator [Bacteroidetes bacterium]|nr:MAG: response regulator [Bacteroidota bacterium]
MKTELFVEDYYGKRSFLEAHSNKELTVFVVDDNRMFLKIVKNMLKKEHVTVLTFESGEECLEALDLEPDVVIIDYHLDGVNKDAMLGDELAEKVEKELPNCDIILISSDYKFKFLSHLRSQLGRKTMYKDESAPIKIADRVHSDWQSKYSRIKINKIVWTIFILILFIAIVRILLSRGN